MGYTSRTTKDGSGVTTDKTTGMASGQESGSRWGLKGSEDLGGGMTASFNYEASVGANVGSGNDNFARRSVLELAGGFGKVGLGRDYNPTFDLIGASDVTGTDDSRTADILAGVRDDNMLKYTSPSFGGFTAKLGLVAQRTGEPASKTSVTDLSGVYAEGPLMAGLAYRVEKPTAAVVAGDKTKYTTLGATYDFAVAKVYFNHIRQKAEPATGAASTTTKETNLGVSAPMGAVTVIAGVGRDSKTNVKSATDYVLGADYSLSKRTNAYARLWKNGKVDNAGKVNGLAIGLRHSF